MDQFQTPKAAIGYLLACERGPQRARQRWSDAPPTARRHELTWVRLARLLYANCGVVRGSQEELQVRDWATRQGPRTKAVRRIEDRLRKDLKRLGMLSEPLPAHAAHEPSKHLATFVDSDGRRSTRLKGSWDDGG